MAVAGNAWGVLVVGVVAVSAALGGRRPPGEVAPTRATDDDAAAARLQSVLAGVSDGVIAVDRRQRVLFANAAAMEMLGLVTPPAKDLPDLDEFVGWPQLLRVVAGCLGSSQSEGFEAVHGTDEQARTLGVQVTPWVRPDGVAGALVVIDDKSRLRRLESHRRDFIANVSHELKTPLAAIIGFVETLIDDPDVPPDRRLDFLARIKRQSDRLNRLVADLLTLSHLDEERGLLEPVEVTELVAVVQDVVRDLRPMAEKRELEVVLASPSPPLRVGAEPEALRQVVSNLVENAIKYTPAGGRVWVRLGRTNGSFLLEVEDTGVGLSPADQERVFERFYRVDKARSRELGGTGLGLSIVKNTVANLGGEVGVKSALGKGSTFWVRLPAVAIDPERT